MIKSLADRATEKVFGRRFSKKRPGDIQGVVLRKSRMLNNARSIKDLKSPPAIWLEKLSKDRTGQHSIRINDQWRACFVWRDGDAYDGDDRLVGALPSDDLAVGGVQAALRCPGVSHDLRWLPLLTLLQLAPTQGSRIWSRPSSASWKPRTSGSTCRWTSEAPRSSSASGARFEVSRQARLRAIRRSRGDRLT